MVTYNPANGRTIAMATNACEGAQALFYRSLGGNHRATACGPVTSGTRCADHVGDVVKAGNTVRDTGTNR